MLDKDMREYLYDYIDDLYPKSRIIDEKQIGKSRADLLVVTEDKLIGYEIKSDSDTYTRLKTQVKNYDKYMDKNYVVIGKSHKKHISEHIPAHWGILCISDEDGLNSVELVREAIDNPKVKLKTQMTLLWRNEYYNILKYNSMPKYRDKSKKFICEKLMLKVDELNLKVMMCEEFFQRDYTLINND